MVSGLVCQLKLGELYCLQEEEKVERYCLPSLSLSKIKNVYSSVYLAAATTKEQGVFISTPKSIFPRAIDRNKIKRRVKSILFEEGFKSKTFGLKFVIKKDFLALDYKDAYNEVSVVVKKLVYK